MTWRAWRSDFDREWKPTLLSWGPIALAVGFMAQRTIAAILAKVGHAGAVLDDSYIHFQYARAIAAGHPLRFQAGAPFTSGATSMLWPAVLAPFWALGARDEAILWPAWGLSFLAFGALAYEAKKLTERLAGPVAAFGAGAMTLAFGGFVWCAASGMEVLPFAWSIARASRLASEWSEAKPAARTGRRAGELVALAWIASLFRPEGALTALLVAATFVVFPGGPPGKTDGRLRVGRDVAHALGAGAAVLAMPLVLWVLTGSPKSNTAVAKLLPGNPYYPGPVLVATIRANVRLLVGTILNGETWSAEFLPHGGAGIATAGLAAIGLQGARARAPWRAAAVLLVALTMFAPCFYYTFLWNRLRYLWPFFTGWIVGLACLARIVGDLAGALRPRWRAATGIVCGVFVGLFASKVEWTIDDVAQSVSGIDRQQVALGRWAAAHLPADARIGVNDTGAIAYFGERTTFDVVGLTTAGEARYWVAGVGSRLEHYERLLARDAGKGGALPTHFIVYPEWMNLPIVLGEPLHEATVTDSTILGGQTMRAYAADWSKLGTGEQPWTPAGGEILDVLDVADLESEAEHGYELLGAREGEEVAHEGIRPEGPTVVDGGRTRRTVERFTARLPAGVAARGVVRVDGPSGTVVQVLANGAQVDSFTLGDDEDWVERTFDLPAGASDSRSEGTRVELRADGEITTFHYWFVRAGARVTPG